MGTLEERTSESLLPTYRPHEMYFIFQECRLKREQDANFFISRLETSLANSNHFTCPKFRHKTHQFAINHFAGTVSYQADELLKKNKVIFVGDKRALFFILSEAEIFHFPRSQGRERKSLVRSWNCIPRFLGQLAIYNMWLFLFFQTLFLNDDTK